jgi:hypothetical protein
MRGSWFPTHFTKNVKWMGHGAFVDSKAIVKTKATADPSTAQAAKNATCFAQDDRVIELVTELMSLGQLVGKGVTLVC